MTMLLVRIEPNKLLHTWSWHRAIHILPKSPQRWLQYRGQIKCTIYPPQDGSSTAGFSIFLRWSPSLRTFDVRGGFHSSTSCFHGYKIQKQLHDCYTLLNVKPGCTQEELKDAYYEKAKIYHPDAQSTTADAKKFDQVRAAYRTVKKDIEEKAGRVVMDDDDDDDDLTLFARHQIQHRQYLDNEGIGFGTRSERQQQYSQYRVSRAQDSVFKHKMKKMMPEGENSLTLKDQRAARRAKMSNSMDRLVEDLIQESMSRGDFDNLPGRGKPLTFTPESPYTDKITQKLNKILLDDGLQPEWIMLHKEIRTDLKTWRENFAIERKKLGDPPLSEHISERWKKQVDIFKTNLTEINKRIDKLNLIVPVLSKQMVHYRFDREYKDIYDNPDNFLPDDKKGAIMQQTKYSDLYSKEDYSSRPSIITGVIELLFQKKR